MSPYETLIHCVLKKKKGELETKVGVGPESWKEGGKRSSLRLWSGNPLLFIELDTLYCI